MRGMGVQRVREVPADSLAGTDDVPVARLLAERIHVPLWLVIGQRVLVWAFRRPLIALGLYGGVFAAVRFRSLYAGLAVPVGVAVLTVLGKIAWEWKLGSASSFAAIVTGMSRRRKVTARWAGVCYSQGLTARTHHGSTRVPSLRDFRIGDDELTAVVSTMPVVKDSSILHKHARDLAAGLNCRRINLDLISNNAAIVTFQWGEHLRRELSLSDVPATGTWERVAFGVDSRGKVMSIPSNLSALIVAESGAGKSNMLWAILAGYIREGVPIRVRVMDPGLVEFAAMRDRLQSGLGGICHQYVTDRDPKKLEKFWGQVESAMDQREKSVLSARVRKHVPTEREPLDLTIIDEALLLADDMKKQGTSHTVGRIAFAGRKLGFAVIALSQNGNVEVLGQLRNLFPTRAAGRLGSAAMTNAVLGEGATSRGARCHELDEVRDRGVGYLTVGGKPKAFRAALVTDADTAHIARGELPPTPREIEAAREHRTTWLYRHWGYRVLGEEATEGNRTLLYVGITNDMDKREVQHAADGRWLVEGVADPHGNVWADVVIESRDRDVYPRRSLAETAEVLAIQKELPLYNEQHNDRNPQKICWPKSNDTKTMVEHNVPPILEM